LTDFDESREAMVSLVEEYEAMEQPGWLVGWLVRWFVGWLVGVALFVFSVLNFFLHFCVCFLRRLFRDV